MTSTHEEVEALAHACDDVFEKSIMYLNKRPSFADLATTLRALDAERRELRAKLASARNDALEEAATSIHPSNPESDWTDYAKDCAQLAGYIRSLTTPEAK